jgi:heme o synthase
MNHERDVVEMSIIHSETLTPAVTSSRLSSVYQTIRAYITLTKPRIMLLLVFTAYCAMAVAAGRLPGFGLTVATLSGLALASGGAAAINMWYDRDIDPIMHRTAGRPLPTGLVTPKQVLLFGILLGVASFVELAAFVNLTSALLAVAGYVYYAVIYTMLLKRRTPQNIVVGGGAGGFPPLVGWAAVAGHLAWPAFALFGIIFLWTPGHFWALALYKNDDYKRAHIPMMPVVRGPKSTKNQMVIYTVLLMVLSIGLYFSGLVGGLYLWTAILLGVMFLVSNIVLKFQDDDKLIWAKRTFICSLIYLPVVFVAMIPHLF